MLKLYILAVCDKIIIDRNGTTSLISLFDVISAHVTEENTIPSNAVAPKQWAVFSAWKQEPQDAGTEYTQVFQLFYPDGSLFKEEATKFTCLGDKTHQQVAVDIFGFPIGQPGIYKIKLRLEHNGAVLFESDAFNITVNYQRG